MLVRALTLLAAAVLFFMMVLGTADVFGRYFFSAPIRGTSELIEILMATLVFSAFPLVTAAREHIAISLFEERWRGAARKMRLALIDAAVVACLVLFAWCAMRQGLRVASMGDVTDYLRLPKAPVFYFIALTCVLTLLWLAVRMAARSR